MNGCQLLSSSTHERDSLAAASASPFSTPMMAMQSAVSAHNHLLSPGSAQRPARGNQIMINLDIMKKRDARAAAKLVP